MRQSERYKGLAWLESITGDVLPRVRRIAEYGSLSLPQLVTECAKVHQLMVEFDYQGGMWRVRCIPAALHPMECGVRFAVSYLGENEVDCLRAALEDYRQVMRGGALAVFAAKPVSRGYQCV